MELGVSSAFPSPAVDIVLLFADGGARFSIAPKLTLAASFMASGMCR
jgi:hypothetical protein